MSFKGLQVRTTNPLKSGWVTFCLSSVPSSPCEMEGNICNWEECLSSQSGDSVQEQHTQGEPSWSQMKILIPFWFTLNWILILLLWRFQICKSGKYLMISGRGIAHPNKGFVWWLWMKEMCFLVKAVYRCFKVSVKQMLINDQQKNTFEDQNTTVVSI